MKTELFKLDNRVLAIAIGGAMIALAWGASMLQSLGLKASPRIPPISLAAFSGFSCEVKSAATKTNPRPEVFIGCGIFE